MLFSAEIQGTWTTANNGSMLYEGNEPILILDRQANKIFFIFLLKLRRPKYKFCITVRI